MAVDLDKLRSISISASATPSRRFTVLSTDRKEKQWERDIPAYRRLREDGVQPKRIDGAAEVEQKADEKHEVEGTINPRLVERAMNS